jgi:ElaB/YqjD/DUF883 family membrane-anchored ribosome-binding protein
MGQLTLAAGKMETFAQALTEAADKLREQQPSVADLITTGSKGMTRLSKNLRETDPEKMADEAAELARRQPGIFLGTAIVMGFLLGQLFSPSNGRNDVVREFISEREPLVGYTGGVDEEQSHEPH